MSGFSVFAEFFRDFSVLKVTCGLRYRFKNISGCLVRDPFVHRSFDFFSAIGYMFFTSLDESNFIPTNP